MFWLGSKKKRKNRQDMAKREAMASKKKLIKAAKDTTKAVRDVNEFLDRDDVALTLFIVSGGKEKK
jgi:hypothetical protein